ncbi:MAG: hypothetical protein ACRDY5_10410, partial [Acidimicrobiales bacterium]
VEWRLEGDGRLESMNAVTDARGKARAHWILGATPGPSTAIAAIPGLSPAVFDAIAESLEDLPPGEIRMLQVPTYDGSGQVVHPDYLRTPAGVLPRYQHLAITPYPLGDATRENPSVFVGRRPGLWTLDPGAPNPVATPAAGYRSDPDLLYEPVTRELWLYYRQATARNTIFLVRSADGIVWSDPVPVAVVPSHELVSPAVVRRAPGDWWMWSVNAGPAGCAATTTTLEVRRSTDGLAWSAPQTAELPQPGLYPWHVDVQWIPGRQEFWAIYNAKTGGGCTTPAVFLATSRDGIRWRVAERPVIVKGRIPEFADIVYRSSLFYDPVTDAITFWYSGARYSTSGYVWSAAVERRPRQEVFAPGGVAAAALRFEPAPAPLEDWP